MKINLPLALIVAGTLCSCSSARVTDVARDTVYIRQENLLRKVDSIFIKQTDSVSARQSNDTVYLERWHTLYQYRLHTDTVHTADSIYVYHEREQTQTVNRLSWLQRLQLYAAQAVLALAATGGILWFVKFKIRQ